MIDVPLNTKWAVLEPFFFPVSWHSTLKTERNSRTGNIYQ